jgi:hypothetical protein
MSTHAIALCFLILLVMAVGHTLGAPKKKEKEPWTAEKSISLLIRVPMNVFAVWLIVRGL